MSQQRRRRRPAQGPPAPEAAQSPGIPMPDAEEAAVSELKEMPARPEDMGAVPNPSLLQSEPTISEPPRDELDDLIDDIIAEEPPPPLEAQQASPQDAGPPVFAPEEEEGILQVLEDKVQEIEENFSEGQEPAPVGDILADQPEEPQNLPPGAAPEVAGDVSVEKEASDKADISAFAYLARTAGPNVLPLSYEQTISEKDDTDSIVYALGAFSDLQMGQVAALRISIRAVPNFNSRAKSWLAAVKMGQNPDEKKSKGKSVVAWIRYIGAKISYDIRSGSDPKMAKVPPPTRPGKTAEGLRPIPASQVSADDKAAWKAAETKARDTAHFEVWMRSIVAGCEEDEAECERIAAESMGGLEMFDSQFQNQRIVSAPTSAYDTLVGVTSAREPEEFPMVLSASELAAVAHIPDDHTTPYGLTPVRSRFKTLPISIPIFVPDAYSPPEGVIPIGIQNPNSEDAQIIGMRNADLDRHMLLVGKTGSGKSELMKWLIFGAAKADYPIVLVDPHGQLSDDIFKTLLINCPERADDLVFCDLSDKSYPVGFNPLDIASREMIAPTVNSVRQMLSALMNLDPMSAPRATEYAGQALTALCEANLAIQDRETKCTLLDVLNFFTDQQFRQRIVAFSEIEAVKTTFSLDHGPFEQLTDQKQAEQVAPVIRAFSRLAGDESFSSVFSSAQNKLDLGGLIQQNKIILIQLARFASQAQLGEFVGSLIVPWMLSSMDRWGRKKDKSTGEYTRNVGCRIFVDEAPRVFSGSDSSVDVVLAEARKWDLGLIMAAQYIEQFPSNIIDASLNNTGSKIGLSCDPKAATAIAKAIGGDTKVVTPSDLAQMPNFHYYGNVQVSDTAGLPAPSGPFSAKCLPPINNKLTPEVEVVEKTVVERSQGILCNPLQEMRAKRETRVENINKALDTLLEDRRSVNMPQYEDISPGNQAPDGAQEWL